MAHRFHRARCVCGIALLAYARGSAEAADVSVSAQCDVPGAAVSGSLTIDGADFPVSFDVFVTDHVPGEGVFSRFPGRA